MSRVGQKERKLAVLDVIKRNKEILFSTHPNDAVAKKQREQAWGLVLEKAKELGLAAPNRTWTYARDNIFTLWKNATLAKRNSASSGSSRNSRAAQLDAIDEAILEIIADESHIKQELNLSTISNDDEQFHITQCEPSKANVSHYTQSKPLMNVSEKAPATTRKRKSHFTQNEAVYFEHSTDVTPSATKMRKSMFERSGDVIDLRKEQYNATVYADVAEEIIKPKFSTDDIVEMRKELLLLEIYKTKLEALKLERELKLPISEYTKEITQNYIRR